jgi:general secretion pathway protein D
VNQTDTAGLGFDWYLGQFGSTVTASGGSEASQYVGASAANPSGYFPYQGGVIAGSSTDQQITSGLNNSGLPTIGTITGILTNPNFRVVIHALEQRAGTEELAAPEVTTTSGRQTEMRSTQILMIITSFSFQQGTAATTTTGTQ